MSLSDILNELMRVVDEISTLVPDAKYMELMNLLYELYRMPPLCGTADSVEMESVRRSRANFKYRFKKERRRLNALKSLHNDMVDALREELATLSERNRFLQSKFNIQYPEAATGRDKSY